MSNGRRFSFLKLLDRESTKKEKDRVPDIQKKGSKGQGIGGVIGNGSATYSEATGGKEPGERNLCRREKKSEEKMTGKC